MKRNIGRGRDLGDDGVLSEHAAVKACYHVLNTPFSLSVEPPLLHGVGVSMWTLQA